MLSKIVCLKCLRLEFEEGFNLASFAVMWKRGCIICWNTNVSIEDNPPPKCPYKLEHAVVETENAK